MKRANWDSVNWDVGREDWQSDFNYGREIERVYNGGSGYGELYMTITKQEEKFQVDRMLKQQALEIKNFRNENQLELI